MRYILFLITVYCVTILFYGLPIWIFGTLINLAFPIIPNFTLFQALVIAMILSFITMVQHITFLEETFNNL